MSETPKPSPELRPEEQASVTEIDHVKIVGYQEFPVPEDAVIGGEPWKAIGSGLNSEGGELVVVQSPVTGEKTVIRGDHLRSTERFTPDPTTAALGTEAVEEVVTAPEYPRVSVQIVHAQGDALDSLGTVGPYPESKEN